MNRYDSSYSAYYKEPDEDYPVGSAVNSTNEDSLDGTPILAKFFNDVIGFMQAVFFDVNGKDAQVSNTPETARKSDVWSSIKKFVGDSVDAVRNALQSAVDAINALIPAQASAENQLADKNFVNSSIATNTAYFIGTFDSLDKLNAYSGDKTNNDYAFVKTTDAAGNTLYNRYKWNGSQWLFEFSLNNSSFTQAQWDAVNSGATAAKINQIKNMGGAGAAANGSAGLVPAPLAGQQGYFLRGDGTWQTVSNISAQAVFDAVRPVGSTYVQYPQQDDPNALFNKNGVSSTWAVINYDGAFFRAQGTGAAPFIDKNGILTPQEESVPNITGTAYLMIHSSYDEERIGALYVEKDGASDGNEGSTRGTRGYMNLDASWSNSAYGRRDEVAPANYTIRVWKRTA